MMKRISKADDNRETIIDSAVEKPLLSLHGTIDIESFWKAVQRVIEAALPGCFVGMTLQHNPILPMIARWTRPISDGSFNSKPLEAYLAAHPRSKFVRASDVFPRRSELMKSTFYRQYMAPQKCLYALGLFFWSGQRLIGVIVIMRTAEQGDLAQTEMKLLQHLYPHFQTALRRLGSLEREHSARAAFEEFLRLLPLPTILLRWNLKLAYQNQAAREFCALWERGPRMARLMNAHAALPSEILDGCRALKHRWEQSSRPNAPQPGFEQKLVHHPKPAVSEGDAEPETAQLGWRGSTPFPHRVRRIGSRHGATEPAERRASAAFGPAHRARATTGPAGLRRAQQPGDRR